MTRSNTARSATIGFTGPLAELPGEWRRRLMRRGSAENGELSSVTSKIVALVRRDGDVMLKQLALQFDLVALADLEVDRACWGQALDQLDRGLRRAMERSARNIETALQTCMPRPSETETEPGVLVGRRPDPLDRVGVYAPGGSAAYPSSVLMGAVPARVAGVREVIVCSPPGLDGLPSPVVMAAAELAGVDRLFAIGGAGAIAAMAYGTESVPRVDRIVGPGNAYVAEAKLQLSRVVAIDSPAGPSELLIIADDSANLRVIAREAVAQAEHDPRAVVVIVTVGGGSAERITAAVLGAAQAEQRCAVILESLASWGVIVEAASLDEAVQFSNDFAPEHLLLVTADALSLLPRLRNAGAIFVGETSSVAFGDYVTGANHVLPTGGLARSYSGLSLLDFFRWTSYQVVSRSAAARLAADVATFAEAEGLPAHAAAARQWEAL